jgi:hypothetical protein
MGGKLIFLCKVRENKEMSMYTFENEKGDVQHITGIITWGGNLEWMTKEKDESIKNSDGIMPMNRWCMVKSYLYGMFGLWKLTGIRN